MLVMEDLQHAFKRKAKIYGEILGYASGNESYDLFGIDPSGDAASIVMKNALENAHLKPENIDYINAHGNGAAGIMILMKQRLSKNFLKN